MINVTRGIQPTATINCAAGIDAKKVSAPVFFHFFVGDYDSRILNDSASLADNIQGKETETCVCTLNSKYLFVHSTLWRLIGEVQISKL